MAVLWAVVQSRVISPAKGENQVVGSEAAEQSLSPLAPLSPLALAPTGLNQQSLILGMCSKEVCMQSLRPELNFVRFKGASGLKGRG